MISGAFGVSQALFPHESPTDARARAASRAAATASASSSNRSA